MFNEGSSFNTQEEEYTELQLGDVSSWAEHLEDDDESLENPDSLNYFGAGKKGNL